MKTWEDFKVFNVVDYEFTGGDGNIQKPICYVCKNLTTNTVTRHWIDNKEIKPIYPIDKKSLFIAYYSSAELGCHKTLNFKNPLYILDLFTEFRCLTNGKKEFTKRSLLNVCDYFGIKHSDYTYKESMRERILQGPPFSEKEKQEILDYCQQDVDLTSILFQKMKPLIDLNHALLRGRYMASVASMEYYGIPIDTEKLKKVKNCWEIILEELIYRVDQYYNVFEGTTFKLDRFKNYIEKNQLSWEYTLTGLPKTDVNFMRQQAKIYPQLKPLQELRHTLGQLRLKDLQIGDDGRNRCLLSPFRSKTGRNQPSTSKFIFGPSTWIRFFIKPEPKTAIAYIDYSQQEIAIAGVLSGDTNLITDYKTGDPYLSFAKKAGAIPPEGTKETHGEIREIYKRCMLALNYGMSTETFAKNVKISLAEANYIVKWHKRRYRKYWEWNKQFIDFGMLTGLIKTNFNWYFHTKGAKYRTLQNWPMQAYGAEILRLAIILCVENGIKVIGPVHDAILIEAPINDTDKFVKKTQEIMEYASECVLDFKINTDVKIFRYPENFSDPRGQIMWSSIWDIISNINPNEIEERLKEKIIEKSVSLDIFENKKSDNLDHVSKKRKRQILLTPRNLNEKNLLLKLQKKTGWSYISLMQLMNEARETDFDIEHEIDWQHENYETAKKKIQQKKTLKDIIGGP